MMRKSKAMMTLPLSVHVSKCSNGMYTIEIADERSGQLVTVIEMTRDEFAEVAFENGNLRVDGLVNVAGKVGLVHECDRLKVFICGKGERAPDRGYDPETQAKGENPECDELEKYVMREVVEAGWETFDIRDLYNQYCRTLDDKGGRWASVCVRRYVLPEDAHHGNHAGG